MQVLNSLIMKNFLLFIFFILYSFFIPVFADIIPLSSKDIKYYGIGVLKMPDNYKVYQSPDKTSPLLHNININKEKKSAIIKSKNKEKFSYIVYIPSEKNIFFTVETNNEDGWYNVYLNQKTGETGWVYNPESSSFYTYKSLFYAFGKKYGVRIFNDLPKDKKVLYAKQSENSQKLEQLTYPKYISFTVISGNWILLTVSDMTKQAKVGWFNWRNDDGSLNMFPNFKEQL